DSTAGSYPWTIPTSLALDLVSAGPVGKIRVRDTVVAVQSLITDTSLGFTVKGTLVIDVPTGQDLTSGAAQAINWTRTGNIAAVNILWSTNNGVTFPNSHPDNPDTFTVSVATDSAFWTVPQTMGSEAGEDGYMLKVVDVNDADTFDTTVIFRVQGVLDITMPDGQGPTWSIAQAGETTNITWDINQGNIQNVKIIGYRDFTGDPSDTFLIIGSTDADNIKAFVPTDPLPRGQGSYPWNIKEKTPSIIGNTLRIEVIDANPNYDIKIKSSANFTIDGDITITTPSVDWKVGDTTHDIAWESYGDLGDVKIEFSPNGSTGWVEITDSGNRPNSTNGSHTFSVSDWTPGNAVADYKTQSAVLRITQISGSAVTASTGSFNVYPEITSVSTVESVPLTAETNSTLQWSYTGTTISSVDIIFDPNGDDDWSDSVTLENAVAIGASPHQTALSLPSTLTANAKIRVRDNEAAYKVAVAGDTSAFALVGGISITSPIATTTWPTGSTTNITWTTQGVMNPLNIYIDYGLGGGWENPPIGTPAYNASPFEYTIPDQVSNNAKIKITHSTNESDTGDTSAVFAIIGGFDFSPVSPNNPNDPDGQAFRVTNHGGVNNVTVGWKKFGTGVTTVELAYQADGGGYNVIDNAINNVGADGTLINYTWDLPQTVSSVNVTLRIKQSTPADLQDASDTESKIFSLVGDVAITAPTTGDIWLADGATANNITWDLAGKVDTVQIEYAKDGSTFAYGVIATTEADSTDSTA
ncbi:MAG: hypothetical protein IID32_11760, partial [Planctomycetes bacterium]|nr:hypothetical protein [Planctomycetota bacterium]